MATCPTCGHEFEPDEQQNATCPACGAPLDAADGVEVESDAPVEDVPEPDEAVSAEGVPDGAADDPAAPPAGDPVGANAVADEPLEQRADDGVSTDVLPVAGSAGDVPPSNPPETHPAIIDPYRPSPLKRAWMDFQASPGKLWIIFKLALFQFVPGVGNLVLNGYVYTWAREQALGRHLPLPQKIVRPGVLDNGLYIYGVSVIMTAVLFLLGILSATVFAALGLSFVYAVLVIVLAVCAVPFFAVMDMRTALCGRVRSGLNLKRAWSLFAAPGKTGEVFAAAWVPSIVVLAASFVCYLLLFTVVMGSSVSVAYGMAGAYHSDAFILMQMLSLLVSFIPITLVVMFAIFFVSTAASIVSARALGYWVQDFHPEAWPEYQEHVKYYMDRAV